MSVGLGYLNQILRDQPEFSFFSESGLTEDDFNDEERRVLRFIQDHITRHSQYPELSTVEGETRVIFPAFANEPVGYWTQKIIHRSASSIALEGANAIYNRAFDGDLDGARELIRDLFAQLQIRCGGGPVSDLRDSINGVIQLHDELQETPEPISIPFGFPTLDERSGGAQGGDYIVIQGETGSGKTYTLLKMALAAFNAGRVPMVVSTEMTPIQTARRILALRTGIPHRLIRMGQLSTHQGRRAIQADLAQLNELNRPFYIMRGSLTATVEDVILHIHERNPDAVYIDGGYLLRVGRRSNMTRFEQVSAGAEALKLLAQEVNKPIIATYQTKKRTDDIYMSRVIEQIASVIIRIKRESSEVADQSNTRDYASFELGKMREDSGGSFRVVMDFHRMVLEEIESNQEDPYE
jgi:replicative DNA helicase